MSQNRSGVWNGKHGEGAMKIHRDRKKTEAQTRNALTLPERRRAHRLERYRTGELVPHPLSRDAR